MTLQTAVAVGAALVALAFAMSTFERWLARHRPHELAWSAALLLFAIASGALAAGADGGWNSVTFRIFYLCGAIIDVPFLALGTAYLLGGRRRGDRWAVVVCLVGAFAAGVMAVAPFRHPLPAHVLAQGSKVFGPTPRILAGVCSGIGALVVIGGAVWSALRRREPRSVVSNGLIAAGTLIIGASGLLNSLLDAMTAFAVTLLVGIVVLFVGFLVATTATAAGAEAAAAEAAAGATATARSGVLPKPGASASGSDRGSGERAELPAEDLAGRATG